MVTKKKATKKPAKKSGKKPTRWQVHLNRTWKEMKKKDPSVKFSAAMKEAQKTYKK